MIRALAVRRWPSRYRYRRTQGFGPAASFRFASRGAAALDESTRLPAQAWAHPVMVPMTITWAEGPTMASGGASGEAERHAPRP